MLPKSIIFLLSTLLFALSTFLLLPTQSADAKVASASQVNLFMPQEWAEWTTTSSLELAEEIHQRLDSRRDEIGRLAIRTVHRFATYQETEPVFFADRNGGGYVFKVIVHWERNFGVVERNHTTTIDWEILYNQHYHATIKSDDSTFSPTHLEELDSLFSKLLPIEG